MIGIDTAPPATAAAASGVSKKAKRGRISESTRSVSASHCELRIAKRELQIRQDSPLFQFAIRILQFAIRNYQFPFRASRCAKYAASTTPREASVRNCT